MSRNGIEQNCKRLRKKSENLRGNSREICENSEENLSNSLKVDEKARKICKNTFRR